MELFQLNKESDVSLNYSVTSGVSLDSDHKILVDALVGFEYKNIQLYGQLETDKGTSAGSNYQARVFKTDIALGVEYNFYKEVSFLTVGATF